MVGWVFFLIVLRLNSIQAGFIGRSKDRPNLADFAASSTTEKSGWGNKEANLIQQICFLRAVPLFKAPNLQGLKVMVIFSHNNHLTISNRKLSKANR